ncbi:MAG: BMP family ABC transporter substrate-binding protein [Chloroflexia bacterium]|nr:BMP family ABC transporter substrate-binding protein [Chloroflexia bacterium]
MKFKPMIVMAMLAVLLAACGAAGDAPTTPGATAEPTDANPTAVSTAPATAPVQTDGTVGAGPSATEEAVEKLNIAMFVNGALGDKSFWDSANSGVKRAKQELGADVRVVEGGFDVSSWEPALRRLAQADYDIILVGTFQMPDIVNSVAPDFPDKKFILFDATVDQRNVANITYAQNEGSFLAGVLAGCVATSDLPNVSGDKTVGVVGGEDVAVINDFVVGYEQGAQYVDPEMQVLKAYVGTGAPAYNDPAKAKELATAQFSDGASIVFQVAGGSGLGVIDAAKDQNRYAIGVDSNQNGEAPGVVLSSMLKRVDNSVFDLIQMEATGSLRTGKTYLYGIQNNGVGLAEDKYYKQHVPQECKDQVDRAKQDIASKRVRVKSGFK